MGDYEAYIALLGELTETLERLAGTAREKAAAVRADDLVALDAVIKREQALALALRGCERRRAVVLAGLGLEGSSLTELPGHCPPHLRQGAEEAAAALRRAYQLYTGAAGTARTLLEINLRQIDQVLSGRQDDTPGPGYPSRKTPEPPPRMKTDIRA